MTIKHIDKTYSQEALSFVLQDYTDTINNETSGEYIQVSGMQIYIDGGDPAFFNHIFVDESPVDIMVEDIRSIIEPNFSQDWVVTIITTVKFE